MKEEGWRGGVGGGRVERAHPAPPVPLRPSDRWVNTEGSPRYRKIVYEAPFEKCDRVTDYRTAWAHFEKKQS